MSEERKRILSAEELMEHYRVLLDCGSVLPITVSGVSMLPFLAPSRDTVHLKKPDRELRRGDIVLYQRENGRYILHRVYKIEGERVWFVGDAQDTVEGPLSRDCILAYAVYAVRKGKTEKKGSFWWGFFSSFWLLCVGKRKKILKAYGRLKR